MKVYVTEGSEEETTELRKICIQKGWEMKLMNRLGRPTIGYDVQRVLNAYRELKKSGLRAGGSR